MGTWSSTGPSGVTWTDETSTSSVVTANWSVFVKASIVRIPGNQIVIRCRCAAEARKDYPASQDGFYFGISGGESGNSDTFSISAEGSAVKTMYFTTSGTPAEGTTFSVRMYIPGGGSSNATVKTAPAMLTPPVKVMRNGSLVTAKNVWVMRSGSLVAAKDIHKG